MMEPNRQRRLVAYGSICVLLLLCSVPPFFSSFARPGRDFWIQFLPALLLAALGVFCGWKFYRLRGFTEGAIGMIAKGVLVAAIFVALLTAGYPVAMWCSKRCKYSGCWEEGTELAYYSGSDRSSVLHHYCKAHREKAPSYLP